MLPPQIANEAERINSLRALNILDTPPEERFDRVTRIASQLFDVPIVLISLVDTNRQWFKSCLGLDVQQTERDISFCGHAIAEDKILVVENTLEDSRFADNPFVAADPHIRFYAGQPLHGSDGNLVGTLCLMDRVPRDFNESDQSRLQDLALVVESELRWINLAEVHHQLVGSQLLEKKAQADRDRFFSNSIDLQCIAGFDGYFHRINPMFSKTLGYTDEEILKTPFIEFVHPDDRDRTFKALEQLSEGADVIQFENRYRCKNGTYRWFQWNTPAPEEDDQNLYAVARDITKIKTIEQALRESEARFKTLVEHSPEAIVLLDLDSNRFVDANQNALNLFRMDRESLLKAGPVDLSPPVQPNGRPSQEMAREKIGEALDGKLTVFEWIHRRSDGKPIPCEVRLASLPSEGPMIRASITDITWRKKAEQELRAAKESAEAANRAKSEFLANMSHEIRTPMNAVIGLTEVVLGMELTEVQKDYLGTVLASAESLMSIIDEILDFSKIEAGKVLLEKTNFGLRDFVGESLKPMALRARSEGLEMTWLVDSEVPDHLEGDPVRLRQVLINLVGNAIKFTNQGTVSVDVTATSFDDKTVELRFAVSDTGIGIPAERLDAVFETFQQADSSTTRRFGGTGLGLAICSRLVELMGGRIWVESQVGTGTTFYFTATFEPRSDDHAPSQTGESAGQSLDTFAEMGTKKILLAEDLVTNQKLAVALLQRWGHRVSVAKNGFEVLELIGRENFDLILMDVQMPEMDGLEATRAIRSYEKTRGGHVPIVAMTAHAMSGDREKCLQAGMDAYVSKPVRKHELYDAMASVFDIVVKPTTPSPAVPTVEEPMSDSRTIDWNRAMTVVESDREMLKSLARAAETDLIDLITKIEYAIEQGDANRIQQTAHMMQGPLRVFPNERANELVIQIESLAGQNQLGMIPESMQELNVILQKILKELAEFQKNAGA